MNEFPFVLRPATESDFAFIWELRCLTMREAVEASYGWEQQTQKQYAAESLNGTIVSTDGQDIGVLTLADWGDQIHIVWLAVHPAFQGKGHGMALLRHSQFVARNSGRPLTLQVLKNNPASRLYLRCGFEIIDESDPLKLRMRWLSPPGE